MKILHTFTVAKEQEVEEITVTKNEKGDEVKTTSKVKKAVPYKFCLSKPTRSLADEADMYYAIQLSKGIQAGLLTRQLLAKRYANDGGAMSDPEKNTYVQLYVDLFEKQNEYQRLIVLKPEAERSEADKQQLEQILKDLERLRREIQEFEYAQITLFDQTAESRARNKTILWWAMYLAYKIENDKEVPLFGSGSFEDRLAKHDEMVEAEDQFNLEVVNKILYYVSFWYMGRAAKPEDFVELDKRLLSPEAPAKATTEAPATAVNADKTTGSQA